MKGVFQRRYHEEQTSTDLIQEKSCNTKILELCFPFPPQMFMVLLCVSRIKVREKKKWLQGCPPIYLT